MSSSRSTVARLLALAAGSALPAVALATTYTDPIGDVAGTGNNYVDIGTFTVTNDATDITFQLEVDPTSNIVEPTGTQIWGKYQIGFQVNPGGSTAVMNPWSQPTGISSGMDFWLGSWANHNPAPPPVEGYGEVYQWNGSTWNRVAGAASDPFVDTPTTLTSNSITISMPLSVFGLSAWTGASGSNWTTAGNWADKSFNFDVWAGFDGGQSAYDALNKSTTTVPDPWAGTPYDSGTTLSTYTITGAIPFATNSQANFAGGASTQSVTVDAPVWVGVVNFDSAAAYTVGGTSTITLDVWTGNAAINARNGSHTISAPIVLSDNLDVTVTNAADTLTVSGPVTAGGSFTINKAGAGAVQFENVQTGSLNVSAGNLRVSAKGTANDATGTSVVQSLSIAAGAQLDLTNNSMVLDYAAGTGPNATLENEIRQQLQDGRIVSSSAAGGTKLGYGDNAVLGKGTFGGVTVDTDSMLIKFTYAGDANLDGQVTISDLGDLASNWQSTVAVWRNGDFNYDGQVTISDLGDLASNWQAGVGSPLSMSFQEALAAVGFDGAAVPEPTTMGLLGLLGACTLKRARRV